MADLNSGLSDSKTHTFDHILWPHPAAPTPTWTSADSHMPSVWVSPREGTTVSWVTFVAEHHLDSKETSRVGLGGSYWGDIFELQRLHQTTE